MQKTEIPKIKKTISKTRKIYLLRFVGRCLIFLFMAFLYFYANEEFAIVEGMNFFDKFSVFHILWVIWICDMIVQLVPIRAQVSIGSQKHFAFKYKPTDGNVDYDKLRSYIVETTKSAYKIFIIWVVMLGVEGILYATGIIDAATIVMITMAFYVCDLICVLIWCPFRLIVNSKCCTTCRIFNWDHIMMFSPLIFIRGFYTQSLVIIAFAIWLLWELCIMMYPERFWEKTNVSLRCSECTDKLCTQYCGKRKSL